MIIKAKYLEAASRYVRYQSSNCNFTSSIETQQSAAMYTSQFLYSNSNTINKDEISIRSRLGSTLNHTHTHTHTHTLHTHTHTPYLMLEPDITHLCFAEDEHHISTYGRCCT